MLTSTPSTAITPSQGSAGQDAGIQIGGNLSNSLWSMLPFASSFQKGYDK